MDKDKSWVEQIQKILFFNLLKNNNTVMLKPEYKNIEKYFKK